MPDDKVNVMVFAHGDVKVSIVERFEPGGSKIIDIYMNAGDPGENSERAARGEGQLDPTRAIEICPKCGRPGIGIADHGRFSGVDRNGGEHLEASRVGYVGGPIEPPAPESHNREDGDV